MRIRILHFILFSFLVIGCTSKSSKKEMVSFDSMQIVKPIAETIDVTNEETIHVNYETPVSIKYVPVVEDIIANIESAIKNNAEIAKNNYPENYGGMYIKNGQLTVMIKGSITDSIMKKYKSWGKSNDIIFMSCEYSYNELNLLRKQIQKFFSNESNYNFMNKIKWNTLGISESQNRVIVTMNCTSDNIKEFQEKVSSSPLIKFEQYKEEIIAL